MQPGRPRAHARAAAWMVTGPLGHAYGGVADWLEFGSRYLAARLARSGSSCPARMAGKLERRPRA